MRMKLRTTKKEVRRCYDKIIGIGYCEAQTLLNYRRPFAYSCGSYGWNCDFYDVEDVCISTGYSIVGSKGLKVSDEELYKIVNKYEKEALQLYCDRKSDKIEELLKKFIKEVI